MEVTIIATFIAYLTNTKAKTGMEKQKVVELYRNYLYSNFS